MIKDKISSSDTSKEKIVTCALELLQDTAWADFDMRRLAKGIKISATDLYDYTPDKTELLKDIVRYIDLLMQKSYQILQQPSQISVHDRLFDVIMCRLEAMQPYKKAFYNLSYALWATPLQSFQTFPEILSSLQKMLKLATISTDGISGMVKIKAFFIIYAIILKEWLKEEIFEPSDMMIEIDKLLKQISPILKIH